MNTDEQKVNVSNIINILDNHNHKMLLEQRKIYENLGGEPYELFIGGQP